MHETLQNSALRVMAGSLLRSRKSCEVFAFPAGVVTSHLGISFPRPVLFPATSLPWVFLARCCLFALSLEALCLFLVMLRRWFARPNLDPCLLLGRQSSAGTFDGKKDAPGAIIHQLLTLSKFSFS